MQLNNLILAMAALAGTALALPAPTNTSTSTTPSATSSSSSSASGTPSPTSTSANRTWPKIVAGPEASPSAAHTIKNNNGTQAHGTAQFGHYAPPHDRCPSLCSLQAQACVVALPNDEAFW